MKRYQLSDSDKILNVLSSNEFKKKNQRAKPFVIHLKQTTIKKIKIQIFSIDYCTYQFEESGVR